MATLSPRLAERRIIDRRDTVGVADPPAAVASRRWHWPGTIRDRAYRRVLRLPGFCRVVLVAPLILGSHALHIRWRAGVEPGTAGLLWSEAVAAEIVVFFAIGRPLLDCRGTNGAAMLAAAAGVLRWTLSAKTAALPTFALIQPLHELTFALLHLVCMRRLAEIVPPRLSATALALYGTVGIGAALPIARRL